MFLFSDQRTISLFQYWPSPVRPDWTILKDLGYKFSYKSSPNIFATFLDHFERRHFLNKNCYSYEFGNFRGKIGPLFIQISGHTEFNHQRCRHSLTLDCLFHPTLIVFPPTFLLLLPSRPGVNVIKKLKEIWKNLDLLLCQNSNNCHFKSNK